MARALLWAGLFLGLALLPSSNVGAGTTSYERPLPPRIVWATADARLFYAEFRARSETDGFGHAYVTLGMIDSSGQLQQTVVAGFMPRGMRDDSMSQFAVPVAGVVGVVRADLVRRPAVRFRIAISKANYYRILNRILEMRRTWTTYELLLVNCNTFVSEIASTAGLRTPLLVAQFPIAYVSELRSLNSP
jgi:hypothetical protein